MHCYEFFFLYIPPANPELQSTQNMTMVARRKSNIRGTTLFLCMLTLFSTTNAQTNNFSSTRTEVHFEDALRDWDGFGFNYVEEAQFRDIDKDRQDYGGFSYLNADKKNEIIDLIFGKDGLQPGLIKMFLDPFHQSEANGQYKHTLTTSNMLDFVLKGQANYKNQGKSFDIITTLYGPPAYMTQQKVLRGRDLNPDYEDALSAYLVDWARFLVKEKKLPLKYISLHNEGDDWQRWPNDGGDNEDHFNHDYNMYWSPEQVVHFLNLLPEELNRAGLNGIGLTPGECYGWDRFVDYGYAAAICKDNVALENLGLITSHGFISWGWHRWNPLHTSRGTDLIRQDRPDMHAWVTSTSWGTMDTEFIRQIYSNIYTSKVNGIIPWAGIQRPELWVGGDPNAGSAFQVFDNGTFKVRKGYYFYKQVCRAGQAGMKIANTISMDAEVKIIAFAHGASDNPDAFVVINMGNKEKNLNIKISGTDSRQFKVFRSTDDEIDLYNSQGSVKLKQDIIEYTTPPRSVSTFFGL